MSASPTASADDSRDSSVHVFVSYAREDKRWLDPDYRFALVPFLMESLRRSEVTFWFDKALIAGDEFKLLIETEIDRAQIALLIVTQHFLNSEFIETFEMPRIAQRAQNGQMIVVPVLVEPCDWNDYPFLADRQMVPSSSPLIHYTESESKWADVRFQILDGLKAQVKRIRENRVAEVQRVQDEERRKRAAEQWEKQKKEQDERQAEEQKEQLARDSIARKAAEENRKKEAEERQKRELQLAAQREKELAGKKAREEAERREREKKQQEKPEPALILWNPGLLVAIVALLCFALIADVVYHVAFGRAGAKWTTVNSGTSDYLYTIAGSADGDTLFACGSSNTFLNSTDGGVTWINRNTGANSDCDSIFSTSDGKQVWAPATSAAIRADKGLLTTSAILTSTDGGANWQTISLVNLSDLSSQPVAQGGSSSNDDLISRILGGSGSPSGSSNITPSNPFGLTTGTGLASSPLRPAVQMRAVFGTADGQRLWAAGEKGEIFGTTGSTASWSVQTSGTGSTLNALSGTRDGNFLLAVGDDGDIVESDDGGQHWQRQSSGSINGLNALFVSADAKVACAVGNSGAIVTSDDKGANWIRRSTGVAAALRGIFGTKDGKHLWVVGTSGTILESNDSGVTWNQRPSGVKISLYSIYGTSDGRRLWIVGESGTILTSKRTLL